MSEHESDPAAALTASSIRWLQVAALIIFPIGTAVCIGILVSGRADEPARVALIAVLGGIASTTAFLNRRKGRR